MILSYAVQQTIKPAGKNDEPRFTIMMQEVEDLQVDRLLGSALYQDVDANPGNYTDLLNGSAFVDCNGNTVTHKGLLYLIAYFNFSEYIMQSDLKDTFTGFVKKVRTDSESASIGEKKNYKNNFDQIAYNAWDLVKQYLDDSSIELWKPAQSRRTKNFKMYTAQNTKYRGR